MYRTQALIGQYPCLDQTIQTQNLLDNSLVQNVSFIATTLSLV